MIVFLIWDFAVTFAHVWMVEQGIDISIPMAPLSTIGIAVAFYIGFKNNQSYDRYWEARKIWGGIVKVSRAWRTDVSIRNLAPLM